MPKKELPLFNPTTKYATLIKIAELANAWGKVLCHVTKYDLDQTCPLPCNTIDCINDK